MNFRYWQRRLNICISWSPMRTCTLTVTNEDTRAQSKVTACLTMGKVLRSAPCVIIGKVLYSSRRTCQTQSLRFQLHQQRTMTSKMTRQTQTLPFRLHQHHSITLSKNMFSVSDMHAGCTMVDVLWGMRLDLQLPQCISGLHAGLHAL